MNKSILFLLTILFSIASAKGQVVKDKIDWHMLSPKKDNVMGTSCGLAYDKLLKGEPSTNVVVAVIDSGIDIDHEDLQGKIWVNEDEIAGNGIDDDQNGYIDDVYGWNFIGGAEGNITHELFEYVRIYKRLRQQFEGDNIETDTTNNPTYLLYKEVKVKYDADYNERVYSMNYFNILSRNHGFYSNLLKDAMTTDTLSINSIKKYDPRDTTQRKAKRFMKLIYEYYGTIDNIFTEAAEYYDTKLKSMDLDSDYRAIVSDNPGDINEKYYGNNDVVGPDADHGTHVAGIIGAVRGNGKGGDGIAENVKIMAIRVVPPEGDERDKDIINGIYYAVDNGARIINMSFGKTHSPNEIEVNKAIEYAEKKGVLIVHGAGNDALNLDSIASYPRRITTSGHIFNNWIEVGASDSKDNKNFVADFSNYGKTYTDLFAPGVNIFSTVDNNSYKNLDGTSMAAPMVTGSAALLMSYFPNLAAEDVRQIILNAVRDYSSTKVYLPGTQQVVSFGELSATGGILDIFEAVKLAKSYMISPSD